MISNSTIILCLIVVSNVFLILLAMRGRRGRVRYVFTLLVFSLTLWVIVSYLGEERLSQDLVETMITLDFLFAAVTSYFFYLFCDIYQGSLLRGKILRRLFLVALFVEIVLVILGQVISDVAFTGEGIDLVDGKLYWAYVFFLVVEIIGGLTHLVIKLGREKGIKKYQIKYVLLGLLLSSFLAITTNLIIPSLFEAPTKVSRIGLFGIIFFTFFTAYAITKYRLMDIRLVIKGSVLYSVLIALFGSLFILSGYYIVGPLAQTSNLSPELIFSIAGIILVFLFQPLKRGIDKLTDKIFFRDRIDYREVIARVTEVVNFEIDFDRLLKFLVESFARELKISKSTILLGNKLGGGFKLVASSDSKQANYRLTRKSPLVQFMQKHRDIIITEEIDRQAFDMDDGPRKDEYNALLQELRALSTELIAPIVVEGNLEAILLFGEKLSGDIYSHADLDFFEIIAPQVGTAIIKAQLYKEQSEWNVKLKKEVAEATRELQTINLQLQQRNNFLISLQKITNLITRSLDFKNVFRVIVDGIGSELQFAAGILYLKRGSSSEIELEEVSHGPEHDEVMTLLPSQLPQVPENSRRRETLVARAIRTGHIQIAVEFEKFVCPQVTQSAAAKTQKLLNFTSAIAVPIFSEDDIIGSIIFLVNKPKESIQEADIQMMKSLADQTGVVTRNLKLYEQLSEANLHLKELDEVKSEFMSIASHQLRTPLTGIMGYLSMLVDGDYGTFPKEQKNILEQVLEASKRMVRLVNVFLNITRIEAGRFKLDRQSVDMAELVEHSIQDLRSRASEKHITITFKQHAALRPIFVDPDKMADVILNLIDNAIKYTEKGEVHVQLRQESNGLRCEVTDTGIGIDHEEAKRLFEKFVRGSGIARIQPDGSGLGLFIAKKIVEAHGGTIGVVSSGVGKGSTFWFEIPFAGNTERESMKSGVSR